MKLKTLCVYVCVFFFFLKNNLFLEFNVNHLHFTCDCVSVISQWRLCVIASLDHSPTLFLQKLWKQQQTAMWELLYWQLNELLKDVCVLQLRLLSCLKEISKSQPSSLWWPEHCKDESKMNLHQQQADVYRILKGAVVFVYVHQNIITLLICFFHLLVASLHLLPTMNV